MPGILLDTNALVRFFVGAPMKDGALIAIAAAQAVDQVYVSPVVAWEAAVAVRKPNPAKRPDLGGYEPADWFRLARRLTGAKLAPFGHRITLEAARVPAIYGQNDPGDCFMIATARVRRLAIVTSDEPMAQLAARLPLYLSVIRC
ncbi:PIN domain-containing protein [Sphingomonas sp.]|uniref:PIN domain-containing protein n=1 Tax=Sphingomonas sp. TaxID=28214 RepID=UPI0035BC433C